MLTQLLFQTKWRLIVVLTLTSYIFTFYFQHSVIDKYHYTCTNKTRVIANVNCNTGRKTRSKTIVLSSPLYIFTSISESRNDYGC